MKKSTTGSSYITLVYHLQKYNLLFGNISKVNKCNAENMIPFNIKKTFFSTSSKYWPPSTSWILCQKVFYFYQILTSFNKYTKIQNGLNVYYVSNLWNKKIKVMYDLGKNDSCKNKCVNRYNQKNFWYNFWLDYVMNFHVLLIDITYIFLYI